MHPSVGYMRALNVSTVEDWAEAARLRGAAASPEEIGRRRHATEQMSQMFKGAGMPVSREVLDDQELLVMGYMSPDEHRAYLEAKYQHAHTGGKE